MLSNLIVALLNIDDDDDDDDDDDHADHSTDNEDTEELSVDLFFSLPE